MTLDDIAVILACSKPAASMLRNGRYPATDGGARLAERYARLMAVAVATERETSGHPYDAICNACPRDDCTGCRIAELQH